MTSSTVDRSSRKIALAFCKQALPIARLLVLQYFVEDVRLFLLGELVKKLMILPRDEPQLESDPCPA